MMKPAIGLVNISPEVTTGDGGVVFTPRSPFSPAVSAGMIPKRDIIVRVGDVDIKNTGDIIRAEYETRTFDPVVVEVIRDNKDRLKITILPTFNLTRVDWLLILLFILVLALVSFDLIFRLGFQSFSVFTVLAFLVYLINAGAKLFQYESLISNSLFQLGGITSWLIMLSGMFFPKPAAAWVAEKLSSFRFFFFTRHF